ncbi:replication protein A 70 kDa DNA-binding subunit B [Artemisia annua]|uniref:Replication protein A 70 kDa DNA-binding subunit B n=1 Tax=Artemisia annua TaxID=35608 RepID=A0A2U1NCN7_ARTAN|nr:replication protein A 70 kDa DNA-binding subunit B [Artemisia annua]
MAQFVNGFINDLSAVKDNVKLRVRVLRNWMQPVYGKSHIINMELIIMDEQNTRIQAQVRQKQVDKYKHLLQEGNAVTLQRYSLGEIQPKQRILKNGLRLSFLSDTVVEKCDDFSGTLYGFDFRSFKTICNLQVEEVGQFDVIGQVIACEDLDCYDKNGKQGKKKPLTLIDAEGTEMRCTLWGAFAQQFADFLKTCDDHSFIIAVVHLAMMKMWDGKMGVQNGYNATKLFLFSGKECVTASQFKAVDDFRQLLLANKADDASEHTVSRISTASKYSTKEDFTTSSEMRHIVELLDVPQGKPSVIVGTVIAICEDEGWCYLGCGKCKKKVVKTTDIVDLEADTPPKPVGGPTEWWCSKCEAVVASLKTQYRLQIRVQDATGTCSVSLFNDEVLAFADRSAYQLQDKYAKVTDTDFVPPEIKSIVGKKLAFKVVMDSYNAKKLLPVFNVMRMSADKEIIESLQASATPIKQQTDNEVTSGSVPVITPFELDSQTDDNTTPTNADKSLLTNKRPADDEADGSMSSNGKKQAVHVKVEKDP